MPNKSKDPLKRSFISVESKIQILDRLKKGEKISHVARSLKLNEATIRTIKKNEEKIRIAVEVGSAISAKVSARPRPPIIEKMEKALSIWIDDSCSKRIPLDGNAIKQKALKIYNHLKESGESPVNPEFVASKGWFERFKKRFSLHSTRIHRESTSPDADAASRYPEEFQRIIKERGYVPNQVFNATELGLCWKEMPSRMFISRFEKTALGFKTSKDRVTLLMCSNAFGDCVIKPMLVYRSSNPRALKGVDKNSLPVHWKANIKAWVTADLFKQWFTNCFVPGVENYLKRKNLPFKVLLVLDDAPCHSRFLSHPNVEVVFLPPNTSSLIQPLDQGIISIFKAYYIRNSLQWIMAKIDSESIDMMQAWKCFSIMDCIGMIASSLKEVKPSTLNACWKNLWPQAVYSGNMMKSTESGIRTIVEIAKSIGGQGFEDMTAEDVQELLLEKEIHEAELLEMASDLNQGNSEDESADENSEDPNFTLKSRRKEHHLTE